MSSATEQYLESKIASNEAVDVPLLVDYLIQDSLQRGASDIHIEPWEDMVGVRVRVNGVLQWLVGIPNEHQPNIAGRFKVMANLESHTTGLPQDGKAAPENFGGVQLRVSIFPTVYGEKIVCRIFNPNSKTFDISRLGFDDETLEKFMELTSKPTGLMLLTGPTGSGKTTAIYAAIGYLLEKHGNAVAVSSVEDPVEQNLDWVNQSSLNPARGYNYPAALRSLMRQDPEIIMVGEIRDEETAEIAINAGMTGHLVISTLHSNTTSGTFARLINMDIEPFLLASTIIGVLGVRLLRTNCMHCAVPYTPEPYALEQLLQFEGNEYVQSLMDQQGFYKGNGCSACSDTGFTGRSSVNELLVCDEAIREAVMQKKASRDIQALSVEAGMRTLWDSGLQMVVDRKTTLEETLQKVAADQV
ncbi:MAG: GspE/PulE family protein [Limisphaerales bacterium]|jgi:type IV pilus assembly protein PilB